MQSRPKKQKSSRTSDAYGLEASHFSFTGFLKLGRPFRSENPNFWWISGLALKIGKNDRF